MPRLLVMFIAQAVVLGSIAGLAGCSGGADSEPNPPPPVADTAAPTVPGGVNATASGPTQVVVTWTASTDTGGAGVAGYRVHRNGDAAPLATVTATPYTDDTVVANTTYTYAVRAFDGATPPNESASSTAVSVTTPDTTDPGPPPTGGLDERPANATCLAGDAPRSAFPLAVERAFPNLSFSVPIAMLQEPTRSDRWYVAQKTGVVRVFDNTPGVSTTRQFVDISALMSYSPTNANDERGLLGIAFHPDYPTDPRVYLFYTATHPTLGLVDRVAQFRSADGGQTIPNTPEFVLFDVDDPAGNHNGGNIAFGPDGFLYIGIGDGGNAGDPFGSIGNGQNLRTLLGKMLRIDVSAANATTTYSIPPDNPYAGGARCNVDGTNSSATCPEIWAL